MFKSGYWNQLHIDNESSNLIFYAIREMKTNWIFCTKSSKVYETYALVMRNVSSVETG